MDWLTSRQMREFLPACPPATGQRAVAFVLVTGVAVLLLKLGVPGASLPTVLVALAVLTVVVDGAGSRAARVGAAALVETPRALGGRAA